MPEKRPPPRRLGFYRRLTPELRREYDRSDACTSLPLRVSHTLGQATDAVVRALASRSTTNVRRAAQRLVDEVCADLAAQSRLRGPARTPRIKVLKSRPRMARGEYHGLYTRYESGESEIKVWMFTAALKQVVRPRTFLRTLLHEVCHHVDMTWLDLPSSLHTIGFHARESSLLRALERSGARVPGGTRRSEVLRGGDDESTTRERDDDREAERAAPEGVTPPDQRPPQLELFTKPIVRSAGGRRRRSDRA